ncbi:MAG: glycosyltransferase family protein [Ignavibacteriales bacterium]|nr:MAG: acylneuraminate cytidylyltransferase [Ignavibacteriaceae bacterium]MBW7871902.1 glycosyltransferase family protein [Ignavibacteria bacterium]MCZ2144248.1 glycosyltransferase family protein [Ignavibacteriales bacterium]OQY69613.1 MAG: acylneuraminate cytidylyltransferase [Ignavibacteriales bacterium UTCHB3]MBV6446201.1 3-deoxy-manno-octulosonate cytidylyltransferase [Ignavibacteriaceae bacterium]
MIPTDKIATVVQARLSSTRLPGKVMLPLAGAPLLQRLIERIEASVLKGTIIVATSNQPSDDPLEEFCNEKGFRIFRGSMDDLLQRHVGAGESMNAEHLLKIPSDVPLIDHEIINRVVLFYFKNEGEFDYFSNLHPATYPDGNDVEIMSMAALRKANVEAFHNFEREHTTPYLWENPDKFKIGNLEWDMGSDYSMTHRWTIDYPEDYQFIKTVYDRLWSPDRHFTIYDILNLLEKEPEIMQINSKYAGVNWYRNHLNELKTITPDQTRDPQ